MSENCKSLVLHDKCNNEMFLSPALNISLSDAKNLYIRSAKPQMKYTFVHFYVSRDEINDISMTKN